MSSTAACRRITEGPVVTDDAEPPSSLAQLTAEIVSAYVSNNKIAVSDVAALITAVGSQMAKVGSEIELPTEEKPEPAVPVRRSIQPDHPRLPGLRQATEGSQAPPRRRARSHPDEVP